MNRRRADDDDEMNPLIKVAPQELIGRYKSKTDIYSYLHEHGK